jgi:PLP dependent protein
MSLRQVLEQMSSACENAARNPADVRLVAVTKGHSLAEIEEAVLPHAGYALELGFLGLALGESRIQEALPKIAALPSAQTGLAWHLIGHLQSNKAKALEHFAMFHALDSLGLAEKLAQLQTKGLKLPPVLAEINVAHDPNKHGVLPEVADEFIGAIQTLGLPLHGLMTIPLAATAASAQAFAALRVLRDRLCPDGALSMGMSNDFAVAIAHGATLVRVGSAIFRED